MIDNDKFGRVCDNGIAKHLAAIRIAPTMAVCDKDHATPGKDLIADRGNGAPVEGRSRQAAVVHGLCV